ncbi:hypothetical protein CBL_21009 [Carabus blaptoides fortunei]
MPLKRRRRTQAKKAKKQKTTPVSSEVETLDGSRQVVETEDGSPQVETLDGSRQVAETKDGSPQLAATPIERSMEPQDNLPENDVITLSSGDEEELKAVSDDIPDDFFISSDDDEETIITTPPIDCKPPTPDIRSRNSLRTPEIHPDDVYGEPDAQEWSSQIHPDDVYGEPDAQEWSSQDEPEFTDEELARLDLFTGSVPVFVNYLLSISLWR